LWRVEHRKQFRCQIITANLIWNEDPGARLEEVWAFCDFLSKSRQVGERVWLVNFMHYDLGYFDDETDVSGMNYART
jgi:hypothetical protein